ncbi:MAG: DUF2219 family protein [Crocinitomix sp.]|nr:DUF2219 family protein [Crocinitomix sp.]
MKNFILLLLLFVFSQSSLFAQIRSQRFVVDSVRFMQILNDIDQELDLKTLEDSGLFYNPMQFGKVMKYQLKTDQVANLQTLLDTTMVEGNEKKLLRKEKQKVTLIEEMGEMQPIYNNYARFNGLAVILIEFERDHNIYSYEKLTAFSTGMIQHFAYLNDLQWLLYSVEEFKFTNPVGMNNDLVIRARLIETISKQMNLLSEDQFAWYKYNSEGKQIIKGVTIEHANDLLTPMGIGLEKWIDQNKVFQKNNDMDYTGALKIGLVTDYLKINRNRPIKSYQTVYFGAEVFTPYFRDTSIFNVDTSFNPFDRPHASFQFFGFETNALSRNYRFRWNIAINVGKIGGKKADDLQTALHQDLTISPRPQGWGAQVANTGRFAFNVYYKPEFLLFKRNFNKLTEKTLDIYPSIIGDFAIGSFQTYTGIGIQLSNKNFYSSNQNFMSTRNRIGNNTLFRFKHVTILTNFSMKYSIHNSMLQGFGIGSSFENKDDPYTPKSIHTFDNLEVRKVVWNYNFVISKQAKGFSFFYKFSLRSPVLKERIDPSTNKTYVFLDAVGNEINIYKRWHHYGTLGVVFKL